jgi:hypothetical protein
MFVVRFADGSSAYTRIAPHIATFGVSPAVMRIVAERQSRGEIPAGNILEIVRARWPRAAAAILRGAGVWDPEMTRVLRRRPSTSFKYGRSGERSRRLLIKKEFEFRRSFDRDLRDGRMEHFRDHLQSGLLALGEVRLGRQRALSDLMLGPQHAFSIQPLRL